VVSITSELKKHGARVWQITETCALISNAFVEADQKVAEETPVDS
jgi:hypothetical protein